MGNTTSQQMSDGMTGGIGTAPRPTPSGAPPPTWGKERESPTASVSTTPTKSKHTTATTPMSVIGTSSTAADAQRNGAPNGHAPESTLRPNRKSIDLPGLNTFAYSPAMTPRSRGSRIMERGRSFVGRGGRRGGGGSFAKTNGKGVPPPRSAAIAIPGPGRRLSGDEEQDTGYGRHMANRKHEKDAERDRDRDIQGDERRRGRTRSRSRPGVPRRSSNHHDRNYHHKSQRHHDSRSQSSERDPRETHLRASSPASRSGSGRTDSPSAVSDEDHFRGRSPSRGRPDRNFQVPYSSPVDNEHTRAHQAAMAAATATPVGPRHVVDSMEYTNGTDQSTRTVSRNDSGDIIRSTIPLTLGPSALIGIGQGDPDVEQEEGEDEIDTRRKVAEAVIDEIVGDPRALTPVTIPWRGPGTDVYLIRAGDEDWSHPTRMTRESPDEPFTTTVYLSPGTHHFRFIVDGNTLVAPSSDITNAVDDQGFIANYVAIVTPPVIGANVPPAELRAVTASTTSVIPQSSRVDPPATSPTVSPTTSPKTRRARMGLPQAPGESFWTRSSDTDSTENLQDRANVTTNGHELGQSKKRGIVWSSEIPAALLAAERQETAWYHAQEEYYNGGHPVVLNGFESLNIPELSVLPQHLISLILNRPSPGIVIPRAGTGAGNYGFVTPPLTSPQAGNGPRSELRVTTASGTDVTKPMQSLMMSSTIAPDTPRRPHPQFSEVAPSRVSNSAGSPNGGTPLIADDPSVLQTPSHAVLHHLCTTSIKHETIAVGMSTRYRQKFLTTVYYKPVDAALWAGQ
ncbi:unnamed protein product [Mycena citricolor]|uniref:Association with the SNF1 complex (ASC) domain-containing protein n=1 Tax=Mycena citricolor TaxID=2018698 RepID=A0AAD2H8B2_9AGAR|nr:unnamed protein product [Mycena citricolor]